jgi:hypothetical protein
MVDTATVSPACILLKISLRYPEAKPSLFLPEVRSMVDNEIAMEISLGWASELEAIV